jgi:hypothetical protein
MMGEVYAGPKKMTIVGLLVFNPLWCGESKMGWGRVIGERGVKSMQIIKDRRTPSDKDAK